MRHLRHLRLAALALAGLAGVGGCPLINPPTWNGDGHQNVNDNAGMDGDGDTGAVKFDEFVKMLIHMTSETAEPVDIGLTKFEIDEDAAAFDDLLGSDQRI